MIGEVRRHKLTRSSVDGEEAERPGLGAEFDQQRHEDDTQLSLFAVLSATADEPPPDVDIFADDGGDDRTEDDETAGGAGGIDDDLVIDLMTLPPPGPTPFARRSDRRERDRLRQLNTDLARELAITTNRSHAAVNAELNRLAGVKKVAEATTDQLRRRAGKADEWLARERRKTRLSRFV